MVSPFKSARQGERACGPSSSRFLAPSTSLFDDGSKHTIAPSDLRVRTSMGSLLLCPQFEEALDLYPTAMSQCQIEVPFSNMHRAEESFRSRQR